MSRLEKPFEEYTPQEQVLIVERELKRSFEYNQQLQDEMKINNLALCSLTNKIDEYSNWNYRLWALVFAMFFVGFLIGKV
ncbi:hypothetical protein [Burkholderia cenocepacia]|uniref:hypothetical protein n=1 Tax=Burkholderia cenocepacia TaxID=95486 RepID=UPI00209DFC8D|nr:hypothetical protein [Burkholderia cenocepacia]MCO8393880.1 hypothetical protein [Burkholderia cenocepacia]MCO8402236.1 hypothetical protein [Burkholderia cenocepacia]MCO8416349.1 hypothetical protein [Burkholderia cenocepacia]MCO8444785.1 hypothetical protein [Burkholderia cenocepacia]MCO8496293.1 hypothetical protein [Burkholderia cenocepacia]